MSKQTLEERVAAVEQGLAEVKQRLNGAVRGPSPTSRWWEAPRPTMTDEQRRSYEAEAPYREYIRQTGQCPPPDWRPGDPIPEPDYWK